MQVMWVFIYWATGEGTCAFGNTERILNRKLPQAAAITFAGVRVGLSCPAHLMRFGPKSPSCVGFMPQVWAAGEEH